MQSLADVLSGNTRAPSSRQYRTGAGFVLDPQSKSTKLDRNAKVRLLVAVEVMERRTKAKGRRNGWASIPGLMILRTLLLRFHNASTGLCCPSIDTLQDATGLCRQTVVTALKRLEAIGVLIVTRRIVRVWCVSGRPVVRQGSNLYAFRELPAQVTLKSVTSGRRFPRRRASLAGSHYPHSWVFNEENLLRTPLRCGMIEEDLDEPQMGDGYGDD